MSCLYAFSRSRAKYLPLKISLYSSLQTKFKREGVHYTQEVCVNTSWLKIIKSHCLRFIYFELNNFDFICIIYEISLWMSIFFPRMGRKIYFWGLMKGFNCNLWFVIWYLPLLWSVTQLIRSLVLLLFIQWECCHLAEASHRHLVLNCIGVFIRDEWLLLTLRILII